MSERMPEWENVPNDIKDYHGFVYLVTHKDSGKMYVGKKKYWFKSTKYHTKKPTKVEAERLEKYKSKSMSRYVQYKKQLTQKYKGKKVKVRGIVESDWKTYWGSSKKLTEDIEKYGYHAFKRVILQSYELPWQCSYYELKYQIEHDVLFYEDLYYNGIINVRIPRNRGMLR